MSSIEIVGSGVVGTATGLGLLERGHSVTFRDVSSDRVASLKSGGFAARLITDGQEDLPDFVFVAVSAPTGGDGVDLTHLRAAATRLGHCLEVSDSSRWITVVFRCTMPPGTMRNVLIPILEAESGKKAGVDFGVAYNPEYLRAASAEEDFRAPRLVTIATRSRNDRSHVAMREVLGDFGAEMRWMPFETAEFHKYVNNVGNAVKISTYNYFRSLGYQIGLTPEEVDLAFAASAQSAEGLWNPAYGTRNLGPYGGACLPKDTEAMLIFARRLGVDVSLLETTQAINHALLPATELAG